MIPSDSRWHIRNHQNLHKLGAFKSYYQGSTFPAYDHMQLDGVSSAVAVVNRFLYPWCVGSAPEVWSVNLRCGQVSWTILSSVDFVVNKWRRIRSMNINFITKLGLGIQDAYKSTCLFLGVGKAEAQHCHSCFVLATQWSRHKAVMLLICLSGNSIRIVKIKYHTYSPPHPAS